MIIASMGLRHTLLHQADRHCRLTTPKPQTAVYKA